MVVSKYMSSNRVRRLFINQPVPNYVIEAVK